MIKKERAMVNKKYLNAIFGSVLIFCIGIMFFWGCTQKEKISYEEDNIFATGGMPFKVCNVMYHDTIYQVLTEFVWNPKGLGLRSVKKTEVITVDSLTFVKLKEGIVRPQRHMDLILMKDTQTLLGLFFNEHTALDKLRLSDDEEKYLIYTLLCRGVVIYKNCESGYLHYDPRSVANVSE